MNCNVVGFILNTNSWWLSIPRLRRSCLFLPILWLVQFPRCHLMCVTTYCYDVLNTRVCYSRHHLPVNPQNKVRIEHDKGLWQVLLFWLFYLFARRQKLSQAASYFYFEIHNNIYLLIARDCSSFSFTFTSCWNSLHFFWHWLTRFLISQNCGASKRIHDFSGVEMTGSALSV